MTDSHPKSSDNRNNRLSRAEFAYQQMLDAIQTGKLKPGDRVREIELTNWLDISRTPVREALNKLESEGLVTALPHRGMIITELDYQAVMELYQMREVLEATAAGLAAKHASDTEKSVLQEILKQQEADLDNAELQAYQNRLFHNAIYHAAHNRYLLQSLNSLKHSLTLLGATTYKVRGRAQTALEEHRELLHAICDNDSVAAEQATRNHIREAQQARIRIINQDL